MTILQVIILTILALAIGFLRRGRSHVLLAASILLIYWLQPDIRFHRLTFLFWLSTGTVALAVLGWLLTAAPEARGWRKNWPAFVVIAGMVLFVDISRYIELDIFVKASSPDPVLVAVFFVVLLVVWLIFSNLSGWEKIVLPLAGIGILSLFVLVKVPGVLQFIYAKVDPVSEWHGSLFSWLGFSYIAFRLLHTFRDRQLDRLPALTLQEYVNYVIFFPAFSAGPIDRAERFVLDLKSPQILDSDGWLFVGKRFFAGLFKKFVLADALSYIALNEVFAVQVDKPGWMWVIVYAYAFQIFFDFSGYTDIAIALGRLIGVRLPENFAAPYLKSNLSQFWNSWHMTLTQWFRAYYFNPLTRALRTSKWKLPTPLVIFITQFSTMLLIGLWHGIAWNFVLWGAWHGIGLFIQNRWSEFAHMHIAPRFPSQLGQKAMEVLGVLLTFHYVAVGWVFFVLRPELTWRVLAVLLLAGW